MTDPIRAAVARTRWTVVESGDPASMAMSDAIRRKARGQPPAPPVPTELDAARADLDEARAEQTRIAGELAEARGEDPPATPMVVQPGGTTDFGGGPRGAPPMPDVEMNDVILAEVLRLRGRGR